MSSRGAPRLVFDDYREKVRLAVERKAALGARTNLEIAIMNTKYADSYKRNARGSSRTNSARYH